MGATRKPTTSDAEYARHHNQYLANREKMLAASKRYYHENKLVIRQTMQKARDAAREARLLQKRTNAYADRPTKMPGASLERNRQRARAFLLTHKQAPCLDCGGTFPHYVLDFDHVRGTKRADLSTLVWKGKSNAILLSEIAKCDLVCANCHRIRTFTRKDDSQK